MVDDLRGSICNIAIHPCTYDKHIAKCEVSEEINKLKNLLGELYAFSKSASLSGERMWCDCSACNNLELRIREALDNGKT